MPVVSPASLDAAVAAGSNGKTLAIGVGSDWYESTSEHKGIILTPAQKGINPTVVGTVKSGVEKEFNKTLYVGTLRNGGVSLVPLHDLQKSQLKGLEDESEKIREKIVPDKTVVKFSAAYEVKWARRGLERRGSPGPFKLERLGILYIRNCAGSPSDSTRS